MYPTSDAPLYKPAFTSNCVILGIAIATYLALPYCLYREARVRKLKTGHAMPLRAMEDAGMLSPISLAFLLHGNDGSMA